MTDTDKRQSNKNCFESSLMDGNDIIAVMEDTGITYECDMEESMALLWPLSFVFSFTTFPFRLHYSQSHQLL